MQTLQAIATRRSVRRYTDQPITHEELETLLSAAMAGPSAVNARDWSFLVVTDKEVLNKMADVNGRPAELLRDAPAAILVCGDLNRSFPPAPDYWIINCSIAAQNICLAAHDMGLGAVWLGTWPQTERVKGQAQLFSLPEAIVPHSIVAIGHPAEFPAPHTREVIYQADRIHWEKW